MTIKVRNSLFRIFAIISAAALLVLGMYFFLAAFHGGLEIPTNIKYVFEFDKLHKSFLFKFNFPITIAGIFFLGFYVTIVLFVLNLGFRKNLSLELTYFTLFLFGCQIEILRLLLPTFGLWKTSSLLLILIGRTIIGARMLCVVSLFLTPFFDEAKDSNSVERNILIALLVSAGIAAFIPLDTNYTTYTMTVMWGMKGAFLSLRTIIIVCTLVAMFINAYQRSSKQYLGLIIGYSLLILGYQFMIAADCYFLFVLAVILMTAGTSVYLRFIHLIYLWK